MDHQRNTLGDASGRFGLPCAMLVAFLAFSNTARADGQTTYISNAEFQKILAGNTAKYIDEIFRTVNVGPHNITVGLTKRAAPSPPGFFSHDKITEIMYVMSGSAVEETGGTLVDPVRADNEIAGPGLHGSSVKGSVTRTIGPGDVTVIPPGVPHAYTKILEPIVFLTIRVDPDRVLKLK
jgi:uncharacterized RmlC-like cupin family protein